MIAADLFPRWMSDAACAGAPGYVFFPSSSSRLNAAPARAICSACPVRARCLDYAVAHEIRYGIWGGATADERRGRARLTVVGEGAPTRVSGASQAAESA